MGPSIPKFQFFEFAIPPEGGSSEDFPAGLGIELFVPTLRKLRPCKRGSIWLYLFWYLFSVNKYWIYFIKDRGKLIHISHVISKNPKLAFLGPKDVEIGPCWTHSEYRGRGLYPRVLKRITMDFHHRAERLFIFAEVENEASLRGIAKAGFVPVGFGEKRGLLGIYRITQPLPSGSRDLES